MKGWLIVNGFLHTKKFSELTDLFLLAAKRCGVSLTVYTNCEILVNVQEKIKEKPDFVLFWDKDILLAKFLENQEIPVYNSSKAIRICDDKRLTYLALQEKKLPIPQTIFAPMTYSTIGFNQYDFLGVAEEKLTYPFVAKEAFGSFGEQVYLVQNREELLAVMKQSDSVEFLFQEMIENSRGRDVRLQVVGDEVVASMYRYSENDFRANITAGGKMKDYTPSKEECDLAVKASHAVGTSFAGVDLLFGKDGPIVCEVNSNAHFKNIQTCTGVAVADKIVEWIIKDVKK